MSKSIMQQDKVCYACGSTINLHRHHCIRGPHRKKAEADGLWVYLCADHHLHPIYGVHGRNYLLDRVLRIEAQKAYEAKYGHEAYMKRYHLNWLEEEQWQLKTGKKEK